MPPFPMLQRRLLCTLTPNKSIFNKKSGSRPQEWSIKQVTKSNFSDSLNEIKNHIADSDFVAVSLQKTGSYAAPWHRVLPFDTAETAYLKAKYAAERFQLLQFAVCPFSIRASKLIAHPYNFHLFPRDELRIGMPCYSFSCQPSYLASMAREDFDFNVCIYDGISYLSREQESAAKAQRRNPFSRSYVAQSPSSNSVADSVFLERIKSRVGHWINSRRGSKTKDDDALMSSLRKLMLGGEDYGSRPSLDIDVCSERQVQLVFEMVKARYESVVPLAIPGKGGGTQAVRVVLTSSKEDKDLLEKELQDKEDELNQRFRGFREVIDLISTSQKPVVAHNSLNDFTFIHSKFLAPLPPTMDEFSGSLSSVFPHILDVKHLMKEIGPLNKMTNLPAAISYLKRRFLAPIVMEIPQNASIEESKKHGHNVVRISELFANLCFVLKITPETKPDNADLPSALKGYSNSFYLGSNCSQDPKEGDDITVWTGNSRKVGIKNLVFLWGFRTGLSAGMLKNLLCGSHEVFSEDHVFDVRLVDKSCAVVVFWNTGSSECFLRAIDSGEGVGESLRELMSEGLTAAGYEAYKRACKLDILETGLADSLDKGLAEFSRLSEAHSEESSESYWNNDLMFNIDDL